MTRYRSYPPQPSAEADGLTCEYPLTAGSIRRLPPAAETIRRMLGEWCFPILMLLLCPAVATAQLDADIERTAKRYTPAAALGPAGVAPLVAEAGELLRQGKSDAAIAALDRASSLAYQSGATGRAFELSLAAAEAQRGAGRLADAGQRFRAAALSNPRDPRAAVAHRTACETLAASTDAEAYDAALVEHLATWPASPFAEEAAWRRVELLARRGRWDKLIEATRATPMDSPRRPRAEELLVAAHARLVERESFAAAQADLQPMIVGGNPPNWPSEWSATQREAALVLARGAVMRDAAGADYAAKLLRKSLNDNPAADPAWRRRAGGLLVIVSLLNGDRQEIAKRLAELHRGPAEERTRLLAGLRERLAVGRSPAREADRLLRELATLAGESPKIGAEAAQTLARVGRDEEALRQYESLAVERPNDRGVQVAYARLLTKSGDAKAPDRWRRVESRDTPNSPAWFEARLGRLRALVRLGKQEEAKKLLALTKILAPSLGGEELREDYEALSQEIELR